MGILMNMRQKLGLHTIQTSNADCGHTVVVHSNIGGYSQTQLHTVQTRLCSVAPQTKHKTFS